MSKRLLAYGAIVLAILFLLLGLIFLIAADSTSRLLTAVALLAIGGALLVLAIGILRRLRELHPDSLDIAVVDLARRVGGEVSVSQVQAELQVPTGTALETLERLRRQGQAQLEPRAGRTVYLFKGVLPAKAVRRCQYCGTEFAMREAIYQCPNCGGRVEIIKE